MIIGWIDADPYHCGTLLDFIRYLNALNIKSDPEDPRKPASILPLSTWVFQIDTSTGLRAYFKVPEDVRRGLIGAQVGARF